MITKERLIELGIGEEAITEILGEFKKVTVDKQRLDSLVEANKKYKADLEERDSQLEEIKKNSATLEDAQKKIDELTAKNKENQTAYEAKVRQMKIDYALERELSSNKSKNDIAVKALINSKLDLAKAKVLDDGSVEGLADVIKALKEDAGTSFMFDTATTPLDNMKGLTPNANQGNGTPAKAFNQMSYSEQLAYAANAGVSVESLLNNN